MCTVLTPWTSFVIFLWGVGLSCSVFNWTLCQVFYPLLKQSLWAHTKNLKVMQENKKINGSMDAFWPWLSPYCLNFLTSLVILGFKLLKHRHPAF